MTLTIYRARDGWRWHLRSPNGRIVAESGEAYTRRAGCVLAWERVKQGAAKAIVRLVER